MDDVAQATNLLYFYFYIKNTVEFSPLILRDLWNLISKLKEM